MHTQLFATILSTDWWNVVGTYKLVPFYKGENTVFDVSPPSMLVSVQHDHAVISQRFQVWIWLLCSFVNILVQAIIPPKLWVI